MIALFAIILHEKTFDLSYNARMGQFLLAIETSCDECSASVLTEGADASQVKVLSNAIFSQIDLHKPFGGVVPEIASRNHLEMINVVMAEALSSAHIGFSDLGAIAVTNRPGLIGALLVGVSAAKAVAYALQKPLVSVDHLQGHIHSLFIQDQKECPVIKVSELPVLICLVSGGHTALYLLKSLPPDDLILEKISETRDDAAGEAFDKGAKLLGLPYPGGKHVESLARKGNPKAFSFPRPLKGDTLEFSFSGLKTAVLNELIGLKFTPHVFGDINEKTSPQGQVLADLCASLQEAIVDVLVDRIERAFVKYKARSIALVGGVSANENLRQRLAKKEKVFYPDLKYCTDNAAMIGASGFFKWRRGEALQNEELLKLNAYSNS